MHQCFTKTVAAVITITAMYQKIVGITTNSTMTIDGRLSPTMELINNNSSNNNNNNHNIVNVEEQVEKKRRKAFSNKAISKQLPSSPLNVPSTTLGEPELKRSSSTNNNSDDKDSDKMKKKKAKKRGRKPKLPSTDVVESGIIDSEWGYKHVDVYESDAATGQIKAKVLTPQQEEKLRGQLEFEEKKLMAMTPKLDRMTPNERKRMRNRQASCVSRLRKKIFIWDLLRSKLLAEEKLEKSSKLVAKQQQEILKLRQQLEEERKTKVNVQSSPSSTASFLPPQGAK
eukprot:m.102545 g.102545  ORF g.102545 m.102545 type:complete len:285 (-) comp12595_c0_seq5:1274-2128(-)